MAAIYVVRTSTGYLGRNTVNGKMTADNPRMRAYVYESTEDARQAASAAGLTDYEVISL